MLAAAPRTPSIGGPLRRAPHANGSDARERLAQAPVRVGHQQRKRQRAPPRAPFGDDVVAVVGAIKGARKGGIGMREDDGDRACRSARRRLQPDGDPAICRER
jgi:hypothetical protein